MNKHSSEFRSRFLDVLSSEPYADVDALYFSGGVDSTTIFFALLELGRKPDLVSFKMDGIASEDVRIGKEIAEHFGVKHNVVTIPSTRKAVLDDVIRVIPLLEYPLKTHIQCAIPFMYMAPFLRELGHDSALTGLAAGDIFGLNKKTNMRYKEHGEEFVQNMRYDGMNNPKLSDFDIFRVSDSCGVTMIDPYRAPDISNWMIYDIPYKELHDSYSKAIVVDAFGEYWQRDTKKWYRPGDNLQIVSGIRELHDEVILNDSELNRNDAKGIISVYNDIRKSMESHKLTDMM